MIGMLAGEPVPDPGEAFWQAMPGRIYREVQAQQQRKRSGWLTGLPGLLVLPRWAGVAAAVLLVAVVTWILVRPAPVDIAGTSLPESGSLSEEMLDTESIDLAEFNDAQLESLDSWASRELAVFPVAISDLFTNGLDAGTDDRLAELDMQELERLSDTLDEYEYEEEG